MVDESLVVFCAIVSVITLMANIWFTDRFVDENNKTIKRVDRLIEKMEKHAKLHK